MLLESDHLPLGQVHGTLVRAAYEDEHSLPKIILPFFHLEILPLHLKNILPILDLKNCFNFLNILRQALQQFLIVDLLSKIVEIYHLGWKKWSSKQSI